MRALLFGALALVAFWTGSLQAQDDRSRNKQRERPADAKRQDQGSLRFNTDELLQDYDRDKDGFVERKEARGLVRDHFDLIDADKDGKLSRNELEQGGVHLQPRRRPSDMVFVLIEMSDCDDDCMCEIQRVYDGVVKLDRNKDGKIDPEELKAGRQAVVEERVDNLFKDLDDDKDGKIAKKEARGMVRRNFDHLDANKDGSVSREELTTAAAEKPPQLQRSDRDRDRPKEPRKDR